MSAVSPTPHAIAAVRPLHLDAVRLDPGGLLGEWQRRNATATLPHCVENLESSGALENMRRVVGESDRPYTGMWFADTDIYKTLEATAWQLAGPAPDPRLREFFDATVALLTKAQGPDGYLDSYFMVDRTDERWQDLSWSHELYCAGHLIQAAVAAERAGVGAELMAVARRFADHIVDRFQRVDGVCGHPEVETALVELYRVTGHRPYLQTAVRFLDLRGRGLLGPGRFGPGYYQDHVPVRDAQEVTGHVVRQLYLLAGMVDAGVETHDAELLDAAKRLWDDAFTTKTYLTGAHGSRHRDEAFGDPYELPPDRSYGETCAAIASFHWNWRMLLATGERRYADEMERVLYNAIAVAIAEDGRHFFYSKPLQLRTGHDGSDEDAPSQRLSWYSCACCPPNIARLMASLHGYVATADDTGLRINLYGSGTIQSAGLTVHMRTEYPWNGRVELTVSGTGTLWLRIPGWCSRYSVNVDATEVDGYLRIDAESTVVVLDLDMPARLMAAHPHVDAVRGCVAITRGPLVYCIEQADLPAGVVLEDVRLDAGAPLEVSTKSITGQGSVYRSTVDLYHGYTTAAEPSDPLTLTAVPYFLWGNRTPGAMRVWIPTAP